YDAISNSTPQNQNFQPQSVAGDRVKGLPMSLKSFTLLDELSLEGSLCKSVQGECCAASLLAGIIFEETSSIRHCLPTKEKISHI
ncbi:hypothetical protein, partial [Micromonospora sp. BL1]|uniref:hypothetical protein n=1 Tax=Micromonospora sp. BL1 TaxID=2478709 RepID=UPI001F37454D